MFKKIIKKTYYADNEFSFHYITVVIWATLY